MHSGDMASSHTQNEVWIYPYSNSSIQSYHMVAVVVNKYGGQRGELVQVTESMPKGEVLFIGGPLLDRVTWHLSQSGAYCTAALC